MKVISSFTLLLVDLLSFYAMFQLYHKEIKNDIDYRSDSNDLMSIEIVNGVFLTSLYYDERIESFRLLLFGNYTKSKIVCYITYEKDVTECNYSYELNITEVHNNHFMVIPIDVRKKPKAIVINNKIVRVKEVELTKKYDTTLCITKMIGYNSSFSFIQLIESNLHFGVDHITLYVYNCSEEVEKIIKYYQDIGILEVVRFNHTIEYIDKTHGYNQRIKINDCFYRNRRITNKILHTDLDEILWPVRGNNYNEMIKQINLEKKDIDVLFLRERIFKRGDVNYYDRNTHDLKDSNIFNYNLYADYTWDWHKYFILNTKSIKSVSIHWPEKKYRDLISFKVEYEYAYIRHTRRMFPYLKKRIQSQWKEMPDDIHVGIINKRTHEITQKLKIKLPPISTIYF